MTSQIVIIIITFLLITLLLYLYTIIAKDHNLTTKIQRADKLTQSVFGAGIIFPVIFMVLSFFLIDTSVLVLFAFSILAIVSFIDDVKPLPIWPRLIVQLISASILAVVFSSSQQLDSLFFSQIVLIFFIVGYINVSNFMDGINGMLVVNTSVTLLALLFLNLNFYFTSNYLLLGLICTCVVFSFGNVRKSPLFISGDVGSISLGFILIWFCIKLYFITHNPMVFLALSVFSIDVLVTLIETIYMRQSPFKGHRNHLYEKLVYRDQYPDLKVTTIYGVIHLLVCAFAVYCMTHTIDSVFILGLSFLCLTVFYCIFKFFIVK